MPFPCSTLTKQSTTANILPGLKSASLIALGKFCDDGCHDILNGNACYVMKDNKVLLRGTRNHHDSLWDIPFPQMPSFANHAYQLSTTATRQLLNIIIRKNETKYNLARFLHAALGGPVNSTLLKAIKLNFLTTFPGLTQKLITRNLPPQENTICCHIKQESQNLQSTKSQPSQIIEVKLEDSDTDAFPLPDSPNVKTNEILCMLVQTKKESGKAYIDLTGRFPIRSAHGNQYILVGYHYDTNAILVEPLASRRAGYITKAWERMHNRVATAGVAPKLYVVDNEANAELKQAFAKYNTTYQLVLPDNHKRNIAKRALQTIKVHFKTVLANTEDPSFPANQWDRLLPQMELPLNLLCASCSNPGLSAWAFLFGQFDYNRSPIAPPGMKVITQVKAGKRASWGQNSTDGWYIGPSYEHYYRCVKVFHPKNRVVQIHDTVTFYPHVISVPELDLKDFLCQAVDDIVTLLKHPPPTSARLGLDEGDKTRNALLELSTIFQTNEPLPISPQKTPSPPSIPLPHVPPRLRPSPVSTPSPVTPAPCPRVLTPPVPPQLSTTSTSSPRVPTKSPTLVPLGLGFPKTIKSSLSLERFLTKHGPPPIRQSLIKQRYNLRAPPTIVPELQLTFSLNTSSIFDPPSIISTIPMANEKQ